MDLCEGYKMQVQEYEGQKYTAIRKFYRHGSTASLKPGVPGFNINARQWDHLKNLKRSLVKAALANETKVVKLGYDKFIEVKKGIIWLKRLSEDCCEEFMKRNRVPQSPALWQKLWHHAKQVDRLLAAPLSGSTRVKYELESSVEEGEVSDTLPIGESATEGGSPPTAGVKVEEAEQPVTSTPKTAASPATVVSGWSAAGCFPQQDTDLSEDPEWYRLRVQAAVDSNARKRQLPLPLRRQEAMKLPKLHFDD